MLSNWSRERGGQESSRRVETLGYSALAINQLLIGRMLLDAELLEDMVTWEGEGIPARLFTVDCRHEL